MREGFSLLVGYLMTKESLRKKGECSEIYSLRVNSNPDFPAQPLLARIVLQLTQETPSYLLCRKYHWYSKDFICHGEVQRVVTCRFCCRIKDCIVHIQAGLREWKVLWAAQKVYSVKLLYMPLKGENSLWNSEQFGQCLPYTHHIHCWFNPVSELNEFLAMQLCALTLAGHRVPTKGTLSLPSSATENTMKSSWTEKGRDHSAITAMGETENLG